jgi:hypothetical protein
MGRVIHISAAGRRLVRDVPAAKVCRSCKEKKPASEFRQYLRNADGLASYCKACNSKDSNAYNKRQVRSNWASRLLHYVRVAYSGAKRRKKVSLWEPYDIDRAFLFELLARQQGRCFWTNVEMSLEEMGKPWSISLDRVDCDRGYTRDNVVLVCMSANLARNDSSPDDIRAFIEMIRRS